MKKKIISVIVAVCLIMSLTLLSACGEKPKEPTPVIPEVKDFNLTVENGTGSGKFKDGTSVTVETEMKNYSTFDGWKVGTEIVSKDLKYTFKLIKDTVIVAVHSYTPSVWDGSTPEEKPESYVETKNAEAKTAVVDINDVTAFAYWRSLLWSKGSDTTREYNTIFDSTANGGIVYTININCDIDLNNLKFDPIDMEAPILNNATLNGNGHSIINMYVEAEPDGKNETSYKGWGAGGFFTVIGGNITFSVKNLNFDNAKVVGTTGQMGVLCGGTYRANLTIDNVNVINSEVNTQTGHKAGGLIGRIGNCGDGQGDFEYVTIRNCSVKETKIAGARNIGGLVGARFTSYKNVNFAVYNNAVKSYVGAANWDYFGNGIIYKNDIDGMRAQVAYANAHPEFARSAEIHMYFDGPIAAYDDATIKAKSPTPVKFEFNEVENNTFITFATTYQNIGQIYTYNEDMYDNTKTIAYDYISTNIALNPTYINTKSMINVVAELKPLIVTRANELETMFKSFALETAGDETNRFDVRPIILTTDIDVSELFVANTDWTFKLPATLRFISVDGAKITGIPSANVGDAKFENWNIFTEYVYVAPPTPAV